MEGCSLESGWGGLRLETSNSSTGTVFARSPAVGEPQARGAVQPLPARRPRQAALPLAPQLCVPPHSQVESTSVSLQHPGVDIALSSEFPRSPLLSCPLRTWRWRQSILPQKQQLWLCQLLLLWFELQTRVQVEASPCPAEWLGLTYPSLSKVVFGDGENNSACLLSPLRVT